MHQGLMCKRHNLKTFRENTKVYLHDLKVGYDLLNKKQKAQTTKKKIDQLTN